MQKPQNSLVWKQNYERYLKTEHWKMLRRQVLTRDKYRCQGCGCAVSEDTAEVHHLSYVGFTRVGRSYMFECVSLCGTCHGEFHGYDEPLPVAPKVSKRVRMVF